MYRIASSKYLLLTSLLLAGCMVGPDYHKPETKLPNAWQASVSTDASAVIQQNWWKNFKDPVLDQLIAKASAGNFDLKIAEARIAEARATRASTRADLLPTVDAKGSATREAGQLAFPAPIPGLQKPFDIYQTGFDASWELDLFGGKKREVESATAEVKAFEASRDDVRVSMLAEVARTYVDIRRYQGQLSIVDETVASDENTLKIATERFKSGNDAEFNVTRAEAQLEQAHSDKPMYQNLLLQAELSMDVLLGEQPGATHAIVATTAPIPTSDKALVLTAPSAVIANRPDIRMAEHELASATAKQGVAVAQLFPDISLSGFVGLLTTNSDTLLNIASKSWLASGNVLWPIFNFGKLQAGIDVADAKQKQALLTYQKAIIVALSDVERSVTAYTHEEEHQQSLNKVVDENHHAADIAEMRYKGGISTFLEVLDAKRTLYASQSQLTEAKAQASQNLIAVYKSLGGGWDTALKPNAPVKSAQQSK